MLIQFIILQTIVFAIVLFFLKRILVKDTDSAVYRLQASYEEIKQKKEELTQRLLEIENEYKQKKEEADKIALEIKEKAENEAYAIRQEAFKKAKTESEDIITKAHNTINKIKEDIRKDVEKNILTLFAGLLKNIFSGSVQDAIHLALVKEFTEELRAMDMSKLSSDTSAIEVIVAKPLTEGQQKELKAILKEKLKREANFSVKEENEQVAGMVLKFGSLTLDGSLTMKVKEAVVGMKEKIDDRV